MARAAFLIGAFIVPVVLLWLGHRLRDRSPAQRGAFWGGLVGHSIAIVVALAALHYPPVLWQGGTRATLVFWSMLLGGALGAAVGALRARSARA
jgi:hypothetical protein